MDQRSRGAAEEGARAWLCFSWRRRFVESGECITGSLTSTQSRFGWANRSRRRQATPVGPRFRGAGWWGSPPLDAGPESSWVSGEPSAQAWALGRDRAPRRRRGHWSGCPGSRAERESAQCPRVPTGLQSDGDVACPRGACSGPPQGPGHPHILSEGRGEPGILPLHPEFCCYSQWVLPAALAAPPPSRLPLSGRQRQSGRCPQPRCQGAGEEVALGCG